MNLLIITASAGMGHNRAADAIEEYTRLNRPEITIKKIDLVNYLGPFSKWFYFQSYEQIIKIWPKFWYFWFWLTENKITNIFFILFCAYNKKFNTNKLANEMKNFKPDQILCTHFAPPYLIQNFLNQTPIATVVTDYYPCRLWAMYKNQKYFVAHEYTKKQLEKYGILPKNIIISGIPVGINFIKKTLETKVENAEKNILIMPAPKGQIKLKNLINELVQNFPDFKITIICGKNKNQKSKLEKIYTDKNKIEILGLINNTEDYISKASIIISKAGGITVSEILTLQKPLVIINPIPGQETKNTKFLLENNLAAQAHTTFEAVQIIKKINSEDLKLKTPDFIKNPTQIILDNFLN